MLTFGDSFTFGWGVDIDESWPKVLEKKLRSLGVDVEVLNCGQPSIWSEQYREYVEKAVPLLRPNLVIVGLLQIEDFVQKLGEISVPPNAVSAEAGYSRFHLMGFLKRLPKVAFRNVWALLERKSKPQTTSVHNEWLKLSQEMLLRWKGLKLARYNLVVSDSVKTMFESGNLNPWLVDGGIEFPDGIRTINLQNPTIMKAISGMEYDLKAIKSVCEKEDCDVVILSVPVAVDPKIVSYNEMGYVVIDEENMRREADTIDSLYGSFAEHIGAKFLGFTDLFRQKSKSMALFYKYDGHFTPAGHRLLGDSLASFLTKNYFNQTSRPR